jgi:tetratricopeptide (TPR) repeat protein
MQGKVKLTKRQVKEDKFTTFMLTSKTQVTENWQYYVIGLVAFLVLVAAVIWYFNNRKTTEIEAAGKLADAMSQSQGNNDQVAILSLNQLLDSYGGTSSVEDATYMLAGLYLRSRNYNDAIKFYQRYLDKYHDNELDRAASYAGIAAAHEDQGDFAAAADYYVKAAKELPGGPLESDYLSGAVRDYIQAGDMTSAEAQLKVLVDKHGGTESAKSAQRLLAENQKS